MKVAYGTIKAKILAACKTSEGLSLREIAEKVERTVKVTSAIIKPMIEHGEIHRAGIRPWSRYFTEAEHAQDFDLRAPELLAKHREQQKEKNLAAAREYWHRTYGQKKKANSKAKPKKQTVEQRVSGLTLPKRINLSEKLEVQASVTWPEHVKVQKIPHGEDTRFKFTPSPDWKGDITRDWMDRRLQAASGLGQ